MDRAEPIEVSLWDYRYFNQEEEMSDRPDCPHCATNKYVIPEEGCYRCTNCQWTACSGMSESHVELDHLTWMKKQ